MNRRFVYNIIPILVSVALMLALTAVAIVFCVISTRTVAIMSGVSLAGGIILLSMPIVLCLMITVVTDDHHITLYNRGKAVWQCAWADIASVTTAGRKLCITPTEGAPLYVRRTARMLAVLKQHIPQLMA